MKKQNDFCIEGETTIILAESKKFGNLGILIDTEDYEKLKNYYWFIEKGGSSFYAKTDILENGKYKKVFMHRLIKDCPTNRVIDHRNGNGLDNRKQNLKICTSKINSQNTKLSARNTTGYRNIHFLKNSGKYEVSVAHKWLGRYTTIEEAINARNTYLVKNCLDKLLILYDRF